MLEFIQNALLWQLFQFTGDLAWLILIALVIGVVAGAYSLFCRLRDWLQG